MTKRTAQVALTVAVGLGTLGSSGVHATLTPYTDFQAFESALAAAGLVAKEHDFEDATAGTPLDNQTIDGISFSDFSIYETGVSAIVSDGFPAGNTRSGSNAIGTTNTPFNEQFDNPDSFTIGFPSSFAVGVWFLTTTPWGDASDQALFANDFRLTVRGVTSGNADPLNSAPEPFNGGATGDLSDTGVDGYFVGFIDTQTPFDEAIISSFDVENWEQAFQFRVDDIYTAAAASAPASTALLALGVALLRLCRYRPRPTAH